MPQVDLDLSDVPLEFPLLPSGLYYVTINDAPQVKPTKDGQSQRLDVQFVVQRDVENGSEEFANQRIFYTVGFNSKVRMKRLAKACGILAEDGSFNSDDMVGKVLKVRTRVRTYTKDGEDKHSPEIADIFIEE